MITKDVERSRVYHLSRLRENYFLKVTKTLYIETTFTMFLTTAILDRPTTNIRNSLSSLFAEFTGLML